MIRKKILLLGDFHVGKTSLIRRFVDNTFDENYLTTIGVNISKKMVMVGDISCELLIWDIEGATPSKAIPKSYFFGASGAIIVADVTRSETIGHIQRHIEDLQRYNADVPYMVACNKCDMLTLEQREDFVNRMAFEGVLTSAKEDFNVRYLFSELAKRIAQ